ncbi:MAG: acetyl-CoA carboxylase, biotin carboxyl carrier protein [Clostridia bacterium]|nr:acetyl-CoA carboxylase, biotin carboxyl carrier protein [Clostridia bacterium]
MKESDIRKYAQLMTELGLTGLEITEDNKVVRLERSIPAPIKEQIVVPQNVCQSSENKAVENNDYISIKSPMVGVFYVAPTENGEPFVKIGERIEKGKILCIIESMKLMNEIASDETGVIEKVCVTNGQVVDYGTELFRIRR